MTNKPLKEKFIVTSLKEKPDLLGYFYLECDIKQAIKNCQKGIIKDFVKMIGHQSLSLEIMIEKRFKKEFGEFEK